MRVIRDRAVLLASVLVVVGLGLQLVSPTSHQMRVDVREQALLANDAGGQPVVYGVVHEGERGIGGADVSIERETPRGAAGPDARRHVVAHATTESDGTFRLTAQPGDVFIVVSCSCDGSDVDGETEVELRPGRAYRIDASLTTERRFVVAPVSGY